MTSIKPSNLVDLNREYSPSNCIEDINIYIQQYIDLSKTAKALATNKNAIKTNLSYGTKKTQSIDIYFPTRAFKNKLMVYIHGGYWQELSKEESSFAATNFQEHGFHFAVIDYTLAPDASMSEIVEENRKAIAWLYQNATEFGYDPEQIYVSGSSAGGHLAMMMLQTLWFKYIEGYQGNIIKGLCAVSGIYDLQPLVPSYVNDPIKMDDKQAIMNSPLLLPLPSPLPVIIAYGENETQAFKVQSQYMADKLNNAGYNVQYKEIAKRNHFDVITDLANDSSWLFKQTLAFMA